MLAIVPLWPKLILGWPGLIWDIVLWTDLVFLAVLLAVRWGRVRELLGRMRNEGAGRRAPRITEKRPRL